MQICTPTCTSDRHSATCRQRQRRARARKPDTTPAYLSDDLGLSEEDRLSVENIGKVERRDEDGSVLGYLGSPTLDRLLRCVRQHGRVDGIKEAALALPLVEYRAIEDAWRKAPTP